MSNKGLSKQRKQIIAEITELLTMAPLAYCRLVLESVKRGQTRISAKLPAKDPKTPADKRRAVSPRRSARDEAALRAWCRPGQRGLTAKQKELVLEVYRAAGRQVRTWVSVNRLVGATAYATTSSLCQAISGLERRGLFATKREQNGNLCVKLLFHCFEYGRTGRPLIVI